MYESIDHIGVVVADISKGAAWYEDNLGWTLRHSEFVADAGAFLAYLLPEDTSIDDGATSVQLVQPVEPSPLLDYLRDHGEGIHHICFRVSDISQALDRLSEDPSRVFLGGRGQLACFLEASPQGVRIELTGSRQAMPSMVGGGGDTGEIVAEAVPGV